MSSLGFGVGEPRWGLATTAFMRVPLGYRDQHIQNNVAADNINPRLYITDTNIYVVSWFNGVNPGFGVIQTFYLNLISSLMNLYSHFQKRDIYITQI